MRRIADKVTTALGAVFLLGTLGATPALAQNNQGSGPHEGVGVQLIGGPLFANLDSAKSFDTETKSGFLVGLALGGNRGGVLGVEGDILYGEKGAKVNGTDFDVKVVHVPVMLKVNIGSGSVNGLSFFGSGGGFFDWQFDSSSIPNVTKDTKGYEVGYVIGGGVEFLRFSAQVRFIRGLREIDRNFDVASAVNSDDIKTKSVAVLFAFRLN